MTSKKKKKKKENENENENISEEQGNKVSKLHLFRSAVLGIMRGAITYIHTYLSCIDGQEVKVW